jgi:hypothetical protein
MNTRDSTITLTYGDQAENHKGMEMIGKMVAEGEGFQVDELIAMQKKLTESGFIAHHFTLNKQADQSPASVLVVKNYVDAILKPLGKTKDDLFKEQAKLNVDKQAFMKGRVVNKHARWNLCFDEEHREPDYANGKGRIYAFSEVPLTKAVTDSFPAHFGEKARDLKGEGNYYYNIKECGIGFHGDSERRKVIAIRLGASLPIHYQWFKKSAPFGERLKL